MACPMVGKAGRIPLDHPPVNINEKDEGSRLHSMDSGIDSANLSEKNHSKTASTEGFEYGIDTDNFNHDFLNPSFDPAEMKDVVSEGILIAGGAVAIILQMVHPGVAAGVNRHSNFAYRVEDRLRTTMTFVYCMAFGTPEEKRTIINMVHHAHAPVKGDGYAADDADAQLWVAATLYATATDIYYKVFPKKYTEGTQDKIYEQYGILATALRVNPEMWPKNRKAFWEYWDQCLATFPVTKDAIDVKNDLLYNAKLPWYAKGFMPSIRIVTAEWMPEHMREKFGFKKHSRTRTAAYNIINAVVQGTYPNLPKKWRTFGVDFYLKDMRKRMAAHGDVIVGTTDHGPKRKKAQ